MKFLLTRGLTDPPVPKVTTQVARTRRHRGEKRCIKCREWKLLNEFGSHDDTEDGHQSYCKSCKNELGKKRLQKNVSARLRHHMSTRITNQLGPECPINLTRDLEEYLGYPLNMLVKVLRERLAEEFPGKKLRDVLNEGWHVDHIQPLMSFPVVLSDGPKEARVDWTTFRRCWALTNLRAIPAEENLSKGSKLE